MKVTVITASLNSERTIARTVKSILLQTYRPIEHLVIDGESVDRTVEIVSSYESDYKMAGIELKIVRERDEGIYFAMNKGLRLASGEVVGFLNSDDFFSDRYSLSVALEALKRNGSECVFGDLRYVDNNLKTVRLFKSSQFKAGAFRDGWHPPHPTFYALKEVYGRGFDTNFKIAADYEMMLYLLEVKNISSTYVSHNIVDMSNGGVSTMGLKNIILSNIECCKALEKHGFKGAKGIVLKKPIKKIGQIVGVAGVREHIKRAFK